MAPPRAPEAADPAERARRAGRRRWSARGWWLALHLVGYAAVAVGWASGTSRLSAAAAAALAVVCAASVGSYAALQRSTPGFLAVQEREAGAEAAVEDAARREDDPLVDGEPGGEEGAALHFCGRCRALQPLRTKHCKDCDRCVRQYDHHCDCAGTCIGERNRRLFVLYLFLQSVEAAMVISYISDAFALQSSVDEWFRANAVYIVAWVFTFFALAVSIPLLIYQIFLIATNQTSWEHARRSSITYLRDLQGDRSPFDRGAFTNLWVFLCGGDRNKWVHSDAPPSSRRSLEAV